jgi:excisionase family DNA binding protein
MKERLLSTREIADFLGVHEKMVYTLISDKGLPATKITGKWLFPRHLVEQWVENNTVNFPEAGAALPAYHGLLIVAGSADPLIERTIALFNRAHNDHMAVFGSVGSMGGLLALKRNWCHMATSHLMETNENEYNFDFATRELSDMPAIVNFCLREQGFLVPKSNPKGIRAVRDLARDGITMVNRPLGTGTRLLFDQELKKAGIAADAIEGYSRELAKHLDVGLEIASGRADVGIGIRAVASLLDIGFVPLRWERYDLMIPKKHFFSEGVQRFLGLLQEKEFTQLLPDNSGYDFKLTGKMVFPGDPWQRGE